MGVQKVKEEKIKKVTNEEFSLSGMEREMNKAMTAFNGTGRVWDGLEKEERESSGHRRIS